mgnify:CR=1 FL=1
MVSIQWVSGSVGQWVSGSVGQWVSGSVGQWVSGSVGQWAVSYTHLRAHETVLDLVCRLLLEQKQRFSPPDHYRLSRRDMQL